MIHSRIIKEKFSKDCVKFFCLSNDNNALHAMMWQIVIGLVQWKKKCGP